MKILGCVFDFGFFAELFIETIGLDRLDIGQLHAFI